MASESFAETIDLLVSDVRMPGCSGPRLARALLGARPGLRILFISGYAAGDIEAELGPAAAQCGFLEKPFTARGLREAARLVLFGSINP